MGPINQTNNPYSNQITTSSDDNIRLVMIGLSNGKVVNTDLEDLYCELNLKKPIPLTLKYDNGNYILIQDNLNLGVDATSLIGAEKELATEISSLYKRLSSLSSEQLGPYPLEWLNYLKEFID